MGGWRKAVKHKHHHRHHHQADLHSSHEPEKGKAILNLNLCGTVTLPTHVIETAIPLHIGLTLCELEQALQTICDAQTTGDFPKVWDDMRKIVAAALVPSESSSESIDDDSPDSPQSVSTPEEDAAHAISSPAASLSAADEHTGLQRRPSPSHATPEYWKLKFEAAQVEHDARLGLLEDVELERDRLLEENRLMKRKVMKRKHTIGQELMATFTGHLGSNADEDVDEDELLDIDPTPSSKGFSRSPSPSATHLSEISEMKRHYEAHCAELEQRCLGLERQVTTLTKVGEEKDGDITKHAAYPEFNRRYEQLRSCKENLEGRVASLIQDAKKFAIKDEPQRRIHAAWTKALEGHIEGLKDALYVQNLVAYDGEESCSLEGIGRAVLRAGMTAFSCGGEVPSCENEQEELVLVSNRKQEVATNLKQIILEEGLSSKPQHVKYSYPRSRKKLPQQTSSGRSQLSSLRTDRSAGYPSLLQNSMRHCKLGVASVGEQSVKNRGSIDNRKNQLRQDPSPSPLHPSRSTQGMPIKTERHLSVPVASSPKSHNSSGVFQMRTAMGTSRSVRSTAIK